MNKSGLGDSPFFSPPQKEIEAVAPPLEKPADPNKKKEITKKSPTRKTKLRKESNDTTTPRYHDTTTPRHQETIYELVRKAVKVFGKEAATHRFTLDEKRDIADIIYTYKNNGIKTSENEISRISVNYIIEDYRKNGENSILHKILRALNE